MSGANRQASVDVDERNTPGHMVAGGYTYLEPIAHGRIALVLKVSDPSGAVFALKTTRAKVRRHSSPGGLLEVERLFEQEYEVLRAYRHPNLLKAHERLSDPQLGLCLVLEHAPGGTLQDRMRQRALGRSEALFVFERLLQVLGVLHRPCGRFGTGIAHLDVEPKNVLFGAAGEPRLCDFHYAREIGREPSATDSHTRRGRADATADLEQAGRLLFQMLCGEAPDEDNPETRDLSRLSEPLRTFVARLTGAHGARQFRSVAEVQRALPASG